MTIYTLSFNVVGDYSSETSPIYTVSYGGNKLAQGHAYPFEQTVSFEVDSEDEVDHGLLRFYFVKDYGTETDSVYITNLTIDGVPYDLNEVSQNTGGTSDNGVLTLSKGGYADFDLTNIIYFPDIDDPKPPVDDGPVYDPTMVGTEGYDKLQGTPGEDVIDGKGGNDRIYGHNDNDVLIGGDGDDLLFGHNGDDILIGGDGLDTLHGGNGADTFVFEADSAFNDVDVIKGFNAKQGDILDISDLLDNFSDDSNIADYVQFTKIKGSLIVSIDTDGLENGSNFQAIAELSGLKSIDYSSVKVVSDYDTPPPPPPIA